MNHTIVIGFRDGGGTLWEGELVNSFRVIESSTSPVGLAIDIDQERDGEIDVLVHDGNESPFLFRIDVSTVVYADEVHV